ncbi:MAG: hypothetical protein ABI859_10830 [Pseudomonadota bacterium]
MNANQFARSLFAVACSLVALTTTVFAADTDSPSANTEIAALKAEVEQLRALLPGQAHAMVDVDYNFANLWFASAKHNWPLATFYLNETRSRIGWTVRLRPIRKLGAGQDLDLRPLQAAIEQTGLAQIKTALENHDNKAFVVAYRTTMGQCHACHVASEKPYLQPHIPEHPASQMIDMTPAMNR